MTLAILVAQEPSSIGDGGKYSQLCLTHSLIVKAGCWDAEDVGANLYNPGLPCLSLAL